MADNLSEDYVLEVLTEVLPEDSVDEDTKEYLAGMLASEPPSEAGPPATVREGALLMRARP